MGLLRKVGKIVDVLLEDESEEKGNDFEQYVANLFSPKYYSIVEWTTDIGRKHNCFVESDCKPDLTIRYKPTGEEFCVECKFRSYLYEDKLQWSNPQQLRRYQDFARESRLPFFVVIGLGGDPRWSKRMFCIPLEEAKYPGLYPSVFEKFERDPEKKFFWKNGFLK